MLSHFKLWLVVLLVHLFDRQAAEDLSTESSMQENAVGKSCKWTVQTSTTPEQAVDVVPSSLFGEGGMGVTIFKPSAAETAAYQSMRETVTTANPLLGTSTKTKRWAKLKAASWQLPANHPRQNKTRCVDLAAAAGTEPRVFYPTMRREQLAEFHVYSLPNALIHDKGVAATPCGYLQAHEACETFYRFIGRTWWAECSAALVAARLTRMGAGAGAGAKHKLDKVEAAAVLSLAWADMFERPELASVCFKPPPPPPPPRRRMFNTSSPSSSPTASLSSTTTTPAAAAAAANATPPVYSDVFAITAGWDNNYHHFIVASLSRLARHYAWLQAHPEVKIHIRGFEALAKKERFIQGGRDMRAR